MPEYIGFTKINGLTLSNQSQFFQIMTTASNWSEQKKQFERAKYNDERQQMMNGFDPQPFVTTTTSNYVDDNHFEQ